MRFGKQAGFLDSLLPARILATGDEKSGKTRTGVKYFTEEEIDEFRTVRIINPKTNKIANLVKTVKGKKIKIPMIVRGERKVIYIGTEMGLDQLKPKKDSDKKKWWFDPEIVYHIEVLDDTDGELVKASGGFALEGKETKHNIALDRLEMIIQDIRRDVRIAQYTDIAKMFNHKKHGIVRLRSFIAKKVKVARDKVTQDQMYDERYLEEWVKDSHEKVNTLLEELEPLEKLFLLALYRKIRGLLMIDTLSAYWDWLQSYRAVDIMGLTKDQIRRLVPTKDKLEKELGKQASGEGEKLNFDGMTAWNRVNGRHMTQTTIIKTLPMDCWLIMQLGSSKDKKTGRMKISGNKKTRYEMDMIVNFDKIEPNPLSDRFPEGSVRATITDMRDNVKHDATETQTNVLLDDDVSFANLIRLRMRTPINRKFPLETYGIDGDFLDFADVDVSPNLSETKGDKK